MYKLVIMSKNGNKVLKTVSTHKTYDSALDAYDNVKFNKSAGYYTIKG